MVARPSIALTAASWDPLARTLLRDGTRGTLHSVFEQAINLGLGSDVLVGVVRAASGNGPATVVLGPPAAPGFLSSGIDRGQRWAVEAQRLVFADRRVAIDLAEARLWPATPTRRSVPVDEAERRLRRALDLAARPTRPGGLGPLLGLAELESTGVGAPPAGTRRLGQPIEASDGAEHPSTDPMLPRASAASRDLITGWHAGDPQAVHRAALTLSGLGPGLTPSGDDLLVGFLIGIERMGGAVARALADAIVAATAGRTTDVAVARVAHAANGLIEERMEAVVAAMLTGGGRDLDEAVARAATWGHTSGVDTLVGLFLGLDLGLLGVSGTAPDLPA